MVMHFFSYFIKVFESLVNDILMVKLALIITVIVDFGFVDLWIFLGRLLMTESVEFTFYTLN